MHEKITSIWGRVGVDVQSGERALRHFRSRCGKKTMKTKNKKEGCSVFKIKENTDIIEYSTVLSVVRR